MWQYWGCRSLWIDECFLAENIHERGITELMGPLDLNQAAPPLFLVLQKLATSAFGPGELALRLFPLLAGVLSVAIYMRLVKLLLAPPAACAALALFSFSDTLIYYSTEGKQYAFDVLVSVAVAYAAVAWRERLAAPKEMLSVLLLGNLAILLSFTAPFSLAGAGLSWLCHNPIRRIKSFLFVSGAWVIEFSFLWIMLFRHADSGGYLTKYWASSFAPSPFSVQGWMWYWNALGGLFAIYDQHAFIYPNLILAALGTYALVRGHRGVVILLGMPALTALVASAMHLYPFGDRLSLFLAPVLPIMVFKGLELASGANGALALVLVAFPLLSPTIIRTATSSIRGQERCDIRPIYQHLQANCGNDDLVILSWHASHLFSYYRHILGEIAPNAELWGDANSESLLDLEVRLSRASSIRRVWVVHAATVDWRATDPGPGIDHKLSKIVGRWASYRATVSERGAAVELYEMPSRSLAAP